MRVRVRRKKASAHGGQAIREKLSAPQTITTTIPEDGAASGAQPTKPGGEEVEEGEADEARNLEMAAGSQSI